MKLPSISGDDVVRALLKAGFEKIRQKGSHVSLAKKSEGRTYKTVVPLHKALAKGTLKDILRQSGITVEDLIKLLTVILGLDLKG